MMNDVNIRKAIRADIGAIQCLYRQLDHYHVRLLPDVFQFVEGDARPVGVVADFITDCDAKRFYLARGFHPVVEKLECYVHEDDE